MAASELTLLGLPQELRDEIYSHVVYVAYLVNETVMIVCPNPLGAVNKQIGKEFADHIQRSAPETIRATFANHEFGAFGDAIEKLPQASFDILTIDNAHSEPRLLLRPPHDTLDFDLFCEKYSRNFRSPSERNALLRLRIQYTTKPNPDIPAAESIAFSDLVSRLADIKRAKYHRTITCSRRRAYARIHPEPVAPQVPFREDAQHGWILVKFRNKKESDQESY